RWIAISISTVRSAVRPLRAHIRTERRGRLPQRAQPQHPDDPLEQHPGKTVTDWVTSGECGFSGRREPAAPTPFAIAERTTYASGPVVSGSTRAGTCLWNGVPANQSRRSVAVSSLGATPLRNSWPSRSGYHRPVPLGSAICPGIIVSVNSTTVVALPRRVVSRTHPPFSTPSREASSGFIQSAPAGSFGRHLGSRTMVLAVVERRWPAERMKGKSGLEAT